MNPEGSSVSDTSEQLNISNSYQSIYDFVIIWISSVGTSFFALSRKTMASEITPHWMSPPKSPNQLICFFFSYEIYLKALS